MKKVKGDKTKVIGGVRHANRDGIWTPDLRLSDPEMKPLMDDLKKRIKEDPQVGIDLMVKAGIWKKSGGFTKKFRGGAD